MAFSEVFVPLESNPDLFTKLIHDIGVMRCLEFRDVYSIDDPSLLALLPRPVLALILVGPTRIKDAQTKCGGGDKDILWFKQTIQNACGLYAILHSVLNGSARDYIEKSSVLDSLLQASQQCSAEERAHMVENCAALEQAYKSAARTYEQSSVPTDLQQLDNHYLCFFKSNKTNNLYQVSGSENGVVDKGPLPADEDVLGKAGIAVVKDTLYSNIGHRDAAFSLIALVLCQ